MQSKEKGRELKRVYIYESYSKVYRNDKYDCKMRQITKVCGKFEVGQKFVWCVQ